MKEGFAHGINSLLSGYHYPMDLLMFTLSLADATHQSLELWNINHELFIK